MFTAEKLDPQATARALNSLQSKIAESTAQARANPFAAGQLFQGVPLEGTTESTGEVSFDVPHGFGSPAVGVITTNVQNALVYSAPRLVPYGDERDNNVARIWLYRDELASPPTADIYIFR